MNYYYVVLGSNINAEDNISKALNALVFHFGDIVVHPRVKTSPWNVEGTQKFINTAVEFWSPLAEDTVKQLLRDIEVALGRPADLQDRKTKDRTCDLDIIAATEKPNFNLWLKQPEYFIQAIFSPDSEFTSILIHGHSVDGHRLIKLSRSNIQFL